MPSYREEVAAWIEQTKRDFGSYISGEFPLHFSTSGMSEDALELYSMMLYKDIKGKAKRNQEHKSDPGNELLYLVPYVSSDGGLSMYDRYSGRLVASMTPTESGVPVYFGLVKYLTRLGGRGEYDTFVTRLADRSYPYDIQQKKAA